MGPNGLINPMDGFGPNGALNGGMDGFMHPGNLQQSPLILNRQQSNVNMINGHIMTSYDVKIFLKRFQL